MGEFENNCARFTAQERNKYKQALWEIGRMRGKAGALAREALGFCPKCVGRHDRCGVCTPSSEPAERMGSGDE